MQVKQRLRINNAVLLLSIVVVVTTLVVTAQSVSRAMEQNSIADALITASFERLALRTDFMRTGSERAREQVKAKNKQVGTLLKSAAEKFRDVEDKKTISALIEGHESIGKIFRAIVANRQVAGRDAGLSREVEERLLSQLDMRVYESAILGGKLQESSNAAFISALKTGGWSIALVFLLMGAATLFNSVTMNRMITTRIRRLRDGAEAIGQGDLEHGIDVTGDDEFTELAASFNDMTAKLRNSYQDLEREIKERTQKEAALRESEVRLRRFYESRLLGVFFWDMDGVIVDANDKFLDMTGYDRSDLLNGRIDWSRMTPPEYRHLDDVSVEELKATGANKEPFEKEYICKDGSRLPILVAGAMLDETRFNGVAFVLDITRRKRAEEALRESETSYRSLFESMLDGFAYCRMLFDEQGRPADFVYLNVNDAFARLTGLDDVLGKKVTDVIPGVKESNPELLDIYGRVALTGQSEKFVTRVEPLGVWFSISVYSTKREHFVAVFDNITERKRAEEALRESEEKLSLALRSADMGVWRLDLIERKRHFDDQVCRCLGIDPVRFGGTAEEFYASVHPDDRGGIIAAMERTIQNGVPYEVDYRVIWPDGRIRHITSRGRLARDTAGRSRWVDGLLWDITERKRAEEALQKVHNELALQMEDRVRELAEKEVLLKEVHHRVKNNLQVISSLVGLQANESQDETVREVLGDVTDRVRSMALVHEKLYQSADLAHIDFAEYVRGLLNYLWRAHGTAAAPVRLKFDLKPVALPVDTAVPCGLILNELAGNALKHAFRGRNEGEVAVSLQENADGRISMVVCDDGIGLPACFDWSQASSLGLRLVQMLAAQLRATVEVSSDAGTKFEISFAVTPPGLPLD